VKLTQYIRIFSARFWYFD